MPTLCVIRTSANVGWIDNAKSRATDARCAAHCRRKLGMYWSLERGFSSRTVPRCGPLRHAIERPLGSCRSKNYRYAEQWYPRGYSSLDRSSIDGRTWVYVKKHEDRLPLGRVFRDYLNCNVQQYQPNPKEAGPSERAPPPPSSLGESSLGTGCFVAPQYVLTNNHVIKDCGINPISVSYPDRRPERAYISGQDDVNDLALLRTDMPNLGVASFRFGPRVGESVAAYGFPLPGVLSSGGNFTLGNVTSLADSIPECCRLQHQLNQGIAVVRCSTCPGA